MSFTDSLDASSSKLENAAVELAILESQDYDSLSSAQRIRRQQLSALIMDTQRDALHRLEQLQQSKKNEKEVVLRSTTKPVKRTFKFDPNAPSFDFTKAVDLAENIATQLAMSESKGEMSNIEINARAQLELCVKISQQGVMPKQPENFLSTTLCAPREPSESKAHLSTVDEKEEKKHIAEDDIPCSSTAERIDLHVEEKQAMSLSVMVPFSEELTKKKTAAIATQVMDMCSKAHGPFTMSRCFICHEYTLEVSPVRKDPDGLTTKGGLSFLPCGCRGHHKCLSEYIRQHQTCPNDKPITDLPIVVPARIAASIDCALQSRHAEKVRPIVLELNEVLKKAKDEQSRESALESAHLALRRLYHPAYDPLHEAVQRQDIEAVRRLISEGYDVNNPGLPRSIRSGSDAHLISFTTPLMLAVSLDNMEIVQALTDAGASISSTTLDDQGKKKTCFDVAYEKGHIEHLRHLYAKAIERVDDQGRRSPEFGWLDSIKPKTFKKLVCSTKERSIERTIALNGRVSLYEAQCTATVHQSEANYSIQAELEEKLNTRPDLKTILDKIAAREIASRSKLSAVVVK